jgi:lipoprotein-anchoring transpeptidase ErfK/SrfK
MRTSRSILLSLALSAALLGACGGNASDSASGSQAAAPTAGSTATDASTVTTGTTAAEVDATAIDTVVDVVATANGEVPVYAALGDTTPASTLESHTEFGSPTTVRVLGQSRDDSWLYVSLPVRPNGATGFVRASDVTLATIDRAVEVDLAARHLRVVDFDGNVILESSVAIGSTENPTPTGNFYVTDVLDTGNDGGAYGPYALGLSAHSDTLSEFAGGDGQIGLHGTNQPSSIGQAASHGCVRLPNDVVTELAQSLPLGTHVIIV